MTEILSYLHETLATNQKPPPQIIMISIMPPRSLREPVVVQNFHTSVFPRLLRGCQVLPGLEMAEQASVTFRESIALSAADLQASDRVSRF